MASTLLFENKTLTVDRGTWGGGGQGSTYHTVGIYAPTYTNAIAPTQVSAVDCWSSATPITGTLSVSGSMLFWPYSVYYDGRSTPTFAIDAHYELGLVVNNNAPIPLFTYDNASMTANNQAGNMGTRETQNWTAAVNVENATSIKLAVLCYMTGEPGCWTNAEVSGSISVAVFDPSSQSPTIFLNVGGSIKQAEKVYLNVGGVIKECEVYLRVGNDIKKLG